MRMGLRVASFATFLSALMGLFASYQIFVTSSSIAFIGGANELLIFVIFGFRCVQFFGSVLTMQWVREDTEITRTNLKSGLLIFLVCQTIVTIIELLVLYATFTQTKFPVGFFFPNITWVIFGYEILCFYFWSVSRRYSDLVDVAGVDGENIGRVPMEDANMILRHHEMQSKNMHTALRSEMHEEKKEL